ncbi:MAG: hypothetical protein N2038_12840 [Geminicoccaceae bacterium]|nr:hypothetical protein [Geminicoccaceae bacterium]MCS7266973.1 hypothetical protein [Geminicoccaceae bacterium]MCX7631119.1 hypothetical protein [Geminicoccaceae bacterium]MDW8123406.1 hypothetical protein [Geminicoccaceae bacterium]MDW8341660.1 hypothetical protein [Geminicoccaceae bacterium]
MANRATKAQDLEPVVKAETAAEEVQTGSPSVLEGALGEPDEEIVTLALSDLVQDANGEIVLFNDSHLRRLALLTEANELARGEAPHHVTAAGEDVTGFRYVTFDNGVTLYYQPDLELLVRHEQS